MLAKDFIQILNPRSDSFPGCARLYQKDGLAYLARSNVKNAINSMHHWCDLPVDCEFVREMTNTECNWTEELNKLQQYLQEQRPYIW